MTRQKPPPPADVRMRGFARRTTVEAALAWIDEHCRRLPAERTSIWQAAGRVLAADIVSRVDVPGFARSMMDGFALQAADTLGATAYSRLVRPSRAVPAQSFGTVAPNLFEAAIHDTVK